MEVFIEFVIQIIRNGWLVWYGINYALIVLSLIEKYAKFLWKKTSPDKIPLFILRNM